MKKVLSVALASAMVLGMGANAFAITYSTGSNQEADWPDNFRFAGELFVTNVDGDIIEESTTRLNDSEAVDFEPGDTIWMPLYADNQIVWDSVVTDGTADRESATSVKAATTITINTTFDGYSNYEVVQKADGKYYSASNTNSPANVNAGDSLVDTGKKTSDGYTIYKRVNVSWTAPSLTGTSYAGREADIVSGSTRYFIGSTEYRNEEAFKQAIAEQGSDANAFVTVDLKAVDGEDTAVGKPIDTGKRESGLYTGNIDKNWSINLIEKSTGVAELIEKAELYKATKEDYASYKEYTDEIQPNAVYLKITLKDEWKTVDSETLTYYVYIADNESGEETNEVWVSGKYLNNNWEYVNFDWTNDASQAQLWKVKKGENGTAVFDFADKAFFTVKMYSGESMYLDLSTAYDKAIAGEMDAEADSFYKFDNDNANFSRTGELIIVSDDSSLVPYEIDEDGNFVEVDAKYVEDYAIAHTNKKVDGFVFSTKTLGNYVLSTEELGQEEQPAEETPAKPVTPSEPTQETPAPETSKPNPETGAEDFVGLAVSLAVVSVAAAGALALKK